MRLKIVIPVLIVGILVLTSVVLLKSHSDISAPEATTKAVAAEKPTHSETKTELLQPASPVPDPKPAPPPVAAVPASIQSSNPAPVLATNSLADDPAYVQAEINRLEELQLNDDDASLKAILKELTNSSPAIRHTAIEATIQFGGHDAVPVLKNLAAQTDDPDERKELLDAAEFLALPTISEVREQKKQQQIQGGASSSADPAATGQ